MFITWITVILGMCNVGILSWEPKLYRTFAVSPVRPYFNTLNSGRVRLRSSPKETEEEEETDQKEEEGYE